MLEHFIFTKVIVRRIIMDMVKPTGKQEVKSPCRLVCRLNEKGMCIGCFRMLDEIANWETMSNEEKFDVLRKAHLRMQLRNIDI